MKNEYDNNKIGNGFFLLYKSLKLKLYFIILALVKIFQKLLVLYLIFMKKLLWLLFCIKTITIN